MKKKVQKRIKPRIGIEALIRIRKGGFHATKKSKSKDRRPTNWLSYLDDGLSSLNERVQSIA
ncbi:hypothetical protein [Candidatus Magnetominusculus dajiuhuensis]|uniref:hypothetical protein n=1 Tax=Candidatus Magnetominusculus dajiuhuensis TaxID=3137712 RepID=UPI003B433FE9